MEDRFGPDAVVFVVDDDANVREGLKELLGSVGLKCEVFSTTSEFLQRDFSNEVSCLILDVRLPQLSGLDLQADLVAARINIPIIFLTGHGDIPMTVKALKAGAVEFLTKPVREQDLLDAVRLALERDRRRREQDRKIVDLRGRFQSLSPREREVMALITRGLMNKQAAAEIGVSEVTVKVHKRSLMKKMGVRSVADLARIAEVLESENASENLGRGRFRA
ncbi:MAG: response regulator transcription factor [Bradyrhizobium sp.]|uniref:response regulator transcription factor n=1 Tax=Bradyrhizobium sp. TaxID=376 RepID=UPI001E1703DE|nr:response regulator [Bradyrhizobium sp.]MBV9562358.1 response regulator transcription factor [Bradyrhizobium sp.]